MSKIFRKKLLIASGASSSVNLRQKIFDQELDCAVEIAGDGIAALEKIEANRPDVILLDIMMPRMSGFEVCKRVKKNPETCDIPVVMVTALNEMGDIERGIDSGADDFLSKPVNKLELLTRVKSLLRVCHLKSELERTLSYLAEVEKEENPSSDS